MDQEVRTLELARLYEQQAYHDDALKIYEALAAEDATHPDIQAGIERLRSLMAQNKKDPAAQDVSRDKIAMLCEKWLRLMILKQRFHNFQSIKARVI